MREQLLAMLELQDAMNSKVHPQWRSQDYAWYRAIWVECAELMEHHGWKWWKKQSPDKDQVVLELVDIWHFGLSILLLEDRSPAQIADTVAQALAVGQPAVNFLEAVERFAATTLIDRHFNVSLFAVLMASADLSFDELYARYVGKNVLNIFRQDQGYQNGAYRKIWQGREDNEHLMEILNQLDRASASFRDDVYRSLAVRYRAAGER